MAIQSFKDKATERFFAEGTTGKGVGWAKVRAIAAIQLDVLDFAETIEDLKSPPGNHLEALKGDMRGLYSIRVNRQWRIVFRWTKAGPADVRICDYH